MLIRHEMTLAQLREAYECGQRLFEGIEITNEGEYPCLSDLSLRGVQFSKCAGSTLRASSESTLRSLSFESAISSARYSRTAT